MRRWDCSLCGERTELDVGELRHDNIWRTPGRMVVFSVIPNAADNSPTKELDRVIHQLMHRAMRKVET